MINQQVDDNAVAFHHHTVKNDANIDPRDIACSKALGSSGKLVADNQ